MTKINPLVRAELEHNAATASLMAERRRAEWRTAIPTSTRSAALGREVRRWEEQAASWSAVLDLVDAPAPDLTPAPAVACVCHRLTDPCSAKFVVVNGFLHDAHCPVVSVPDPGMPLDLSPDLEDAAHAAGLTPGELLRTPKALHYCGRSGCGHGDNVHGPFCFAAGCGCVDWRWHPFADTVPLCPFCGHGEHGPDTEDMRICEQIGCACCSEREERR